MMMMMVKKKKIKEENEDDEYVKSSQSSTPLLLPRLANGRTSLCLLWCCCCLLLVIAFLFFFNLTRTLANVNFSRRRHKARRRKMVLREMFVFSSLSLLGVGGLSMKNKTIFNTRAFTSGANNVFRALTLAKHRWSRWSSRE